MKLILSSYSVDSLVTDYLSFSYFFVPSQVKGNIILSSYYYWIISYSFCLHSAHNFSFFLWFQLKFIFNLIDFFSLAWFGIMILTWNVKVDWGSSGYQACSAVNWAGLRKGQFWNSNLMRKFTLKNEETSVPPPPTSQNIQHVVRGPAL